LGFEEPNGPARSEEILRLLGLKREMPRPKPESERTEIGLRHTVGGTKTGVEMVWWGRNPIEQEGGGTVTEKGLGVCLRKGRRMGRWSSGHTQTRLPLKKEGDAWGKRGREQKIPEANLLRS